MKSPQASTALSVAGSIVVLNILVLTSFGQRELVATKFKIESGARRILKSIYYVSTSPEFHGYI